MNFEQATQALDTLTNALKNGEQHGIMLENEAILLKQENMRLRTALEHRTEELDKTSTKLIDSEHQLITEVRNNGELKATLKQLLAEQMALASRAAEMLRSLEEKPKPVIVEKIEITKPTFATDLDDARKKDQEERFLERHVEVTLTAIASVPAGETFVLDAPYGERVTDWILQKWYRRILGKAPSNFKDAPSIELRKDGQAWVFLRQVPKLTYSNKEDREPIPFRTKENENGDGTIIQTAFPPDDGQELPKFLTKPNGTTSDDNQGRKASDL